MIYNPQSSIYNPMWPPQGGPMDPRERPVGQIVRDPAAMTTADIQHEMMGMPMGFSSQAPAGLGGIFAGLGGFPGIGAIMGGMAQAGSNQHYGNLFTENQNRQIANQYPPAASLMNGGGGMMETGTHQGSMAQPGLGDWDDETGFGGA